MLLRTGVDGCEQLSQSSQDWKSNPRPPNGKSDDQPVAPPRHPDVDGLQTLSGTRTQPLHRESDVDVLLDVVEGPR